MSDEQMSRWNQVMAVLLVTSMGLAGAATIVPLAEFNVDTLVGIATFKLDSEWTASEVTYTGSAEELGVEVEGDQRFLGGLGGFQERIGFLKGTSKEVTNYIVPFTTDFLGKRAKLNVTLRTETIPWWVVGVGTATEVEVEVEEMKNVSSLTVVRVFLQFRREVDGKVQTMEAWSKDVSDKLAKVGDKRTYGTDLEVSEDWGEFQVFGMVEVTMVDANGITATQVYRSYSTEPNAITLWTVPTMEGVRIAMVIAAMPVYVLGIVVAALGVVAVLRRTRGRTVLPMAGGVALLLGVMFYFLGLTQLTELVGYPDDLAWSAGFYLMAAGAVPALVVGGLAVNQHFRSGDYDDDKGDGPAGAPAYAENTITDEGTVVEEDDR